MMFIPPAAACWPPSAVAATGLRLGLDDASAQGLPADPAMPRRRRADRASDRGAVLQAEFAAARRPGRASSKGRLVELSGQVLSRGCRPLQALVDLWHADERGQYDNSGFRYRGHLFTDGEGRYRFRTILPALYTGRTRHYHVKVQALDRAVLTTQLYFPADEAANRRDGLFRRELLMRVADAGDGLAARFDFILDVR